MQMMEWTEYKLEELLAYEQPTAYIVNSTDYHESYKTPVLTAGKSFIIGYTDETTGIYDKLPVIIFDDFTTASQYVNFQFKVKSSAMKILTANSELVLPKFIFYKMQTIQFNHDTHKRYWIQQYSQIKVKVPQLPEQERIVAKIEELFSQLDAAVAELKSVKEKLAIYRQAVLKEAFEGKISSRNKYDYVLDNQFRKISSRELEKLNPIPEHWRYVYLSDLGELARGKSKHRPRNDSRLFENGKYPFFQTGDVKSAQKELIECEKKYGDFGLAQSKLWSKGTLCITIAANIAETCFLGVDACFPDSIVGFTPNEAIVDKAYVRWFIEISKAQLWAFAPATAQKNINLTTLENLIVPYCSLKEQKIIVQDIEEKISVCNNIEQTVDTALQQAAALRQSILKQAFEGNL